MEKEGNDISGKKKEQWQTCRNFKVYGLLEENNSVLGLNLGVHEAGGGKAK